MERRGFLQIFGFSAATGVALAAGSQLSTSAPLQAIAVRTKDRKLSADYSANQIPITWHYNLGEVLGTWAAECTDDEGDQAIIPHQVRFVTNPGDDPKLSKAQMELALADAQEMMYEFESCSIQWREVSWISYTPRKLTWSNRATLSQLRVRSSCLRTAENSIISMKHRMMRRKAAVLSGQDY